MSEIHPKLPESGKPIIRRVRKKMEMTLRFRIRTSQKNDVAPRNLQIRLTVEGETATDYGSGVMVRPTKWNQKDQIVVGRDKSSAELNERIAQIDLQHREILRELKRRFAKGDGPRPTAALIKAEFISPGASSPTLCGWYNRYLDYLDSLQGLEDGQAEKTMARAYKVRDDIRAFSGNDKKPGSTDHSPLLNDLVTNWGKRFHAWLQVNPVTGKHRMLKDSANKYLSHVRDALDYAIDEGYLSKNPLDRYRPKRGKGKPVYFLEPDHMARLSTLAFPGELGDALWWCRLMCFTALDYKDAVRYARNRFAHEEMTPNGIKIVIQRAKPPHNVCEIPMLPEVMDLFMHHPSGPPIDYELEDINSHLRTTIRTALEFDRTFTTKICRKTGGAHFLRIGYSIEAVSRFMGHTSIRTTQDYYVRITSSYVDAEMRRVREMRLNPGLPIDRIVRLPPPLNG